MSPPSHLATAPFSAPATRIALPRLKTHTKYTAPATKCGNIISCQLQQNLHHTTWRFRPVLSTLPSTKIAISAETGHENSASMPHPETQIPMARPHPTPQKHDSPNANSQWNCVANCGSHKTLRLCSEMHHVACATCQFQAIHHGIAAQTDTSHIHEKFLAKASPNGSA